MRSSSRVVFRTTRAVTHDAVRNTEPTTEQIGPVGDTSQKNDRPNAITAMVIAPIPMPRNAVCNTLNATAMYARA